MPQDDPLSSPGAAQAGAMPEWARALLIDAVTTVSEEIAGLRALHQTQRDAQGDPGTSSQAHAAQAPHTDEGHRRDALRARILGLWDRASGVHVEDPERVVAWVERNGQDLLARTKSGWDKVARHIVDELVPEPGEEKASRERYAAVQRWEDVAKRAVERFVDASLERQHDRRGR